MSEILNLTPAIHPVDGIVAAKIRSRRKALKMSQRQLADQIGTTFQQVQKYENATNRVSASRLMAIASALGSSVQWFFDSVADQPATPVGEPAFTAPGLDREDVADMRELISLWPQIAVRQRHIVLQLVRDLSKQRGHEA